MSDVGESQPDPDAEAQDEGAEQHVDPARPLARTFLVFLLALLVKLVLLAKHDPRVNSAGAHTASVWGTGTYLLRRRSLSLWLRLGLRRLNMWDRSQNRSTVDELDARRELECWAWGATRLAVLTGALDECVDLGDGQVSIDKIADVVRDHGTPVRAVLCVVIGVATESPETLPAEVVVAA